VANDAKTMITLIDAPDDGPAPRSRAGCAHTTRRRRISRRATARRPRPRSRNEEVAGGLLGRTVLGLLTMELFFLPEGLRRDRLGSRILAMAEAEARRRGCTRAVLSTLHFQAPGFYLKQGWEVAARIDCEPPGHTRFYMTKKLS
jgi:GNAT superfamily N-acetyltransferase